MSHLSRDVLALHIKNTTLLKRRKRYLFEDTFQSLYVKFILYIFVFLGIFVCLRCLVRIMYFLLR